MKKFRNIKIVWLAVFLILCSVFLCSCDKNEEGTSPTVTVPETYTVSFPDAYGFSFSPCGGSLEVSEGGEFSFTVDTIFNDKSLGFVISANGIPVSSDQSNVYSIQNITADTAISVESAYLNELSVSLQNIPDGVTVVLDDYSVNFEQEVNFTLSLAAGVNQSIPEVYVNGIKITASDGVFSAVVTQNTVITVGSVNLNTYTVNYLSGGNGAISGSAAQTVNHGASTTAVTAIPDENYVFYMWSDGVATAARTDLNLSSDKNVYAIFALRTNTVSWDAQGKYLLTLNGEVLAAEETKVNLGEDFSFSIELASRYDKSVIVVKANGNILQAVEGVYTVPAVAENREITIEGIELNTYLVSLLEPDGITFNTDDELIITHGESFAFTITVADVYTESELIVKANGEALSPVSGEYTANIISDTAITVEGIELNTYEVNFDTLGGREIADKYVFAGGSVELPYALKNDCLFDGWSYDGSIFEDGESIIDIQSDITVTARFLTASEHMTYWDGGARCNIDDNEGYYFSGTIVIPDMHNDIFITSVRGGQRCGDVTEIATGDYVEYFDIPFIYFSSLASVSLPKNLKALPNFAGNYLTMTEIVIPAGITEIPAGCFSDFRTLETVTCLGSITKIGDGAFQNANKLRSLELNDGLTEIGTYAFRFCADLTNIAFPSTLLKIGYQAFYGSGITSVLLPAGVELAEGAFYQCLSLASAEKEDGFPAVKELFYGCSALSGGITVTGLADSMFSGCGNLTSVTVSNDVTSIPAYAFRGCGAVVSFTDKNLITEICEGAFSGARPSSGFALDGLNNITSIADNAFNYSTLTSFKFDCNGELTVGNDAFYCPELTTFGSLAGKCEISANLISLGINNFTYCSFSELVFEDGFALASIPEGSFGHTVFGSTVLSIPEGVTSIGNNAFSYVNMFDASHYSTSVFVTKIELPSTLLSIGSNAFSKINSSLAFDYENDEFIYLSARDFTVSVAADSPFTVGNNAFQHKYHDMEDNVLLRYTTFVSDTEAVSDAYETAWITNGGYLYDSSDEFFPLFTSAEAETQTLTEYTAIFELNDGTETDFSTENFYSGYYLHCPITDPTRANYDFLGWKRNVSDTEYFDFGTKITENNDISLYAVWQAVSFNLLYNLDGGTNGAGNPAFYTVEDDIIFEDAIYEGHTFDGWYSDGAFTTEVTGITAGTTGTVMVYAKYSLIIHTVDFVTNGGSEIASRPVLHGNKLVMTGSTLKTGSTFASWYTDAELNNLYDFNTLVTNGFTLYAKWTENQYTVKYYYRPSKTNVLLFADTYVYGDTVEAHSAPEFEGYTASGWYSDQNYTSAGVFPFTMSTENKTFYCYLTANTYLVQYNSNGGFGNINNQTCIYGYNYILYGNTFTKTGYDFSGWAAEADGEAVYAGNAIINNLTAVSGATVNLYAKWQANAYDIAYNANSGEGNMDNTAATYDAAQNLTANSYTKTGYTFGGWSLVCGAAADYTDGGSVSNLTNVSGVTVTLYAVWTANGCDVIFNNGGETSTQHFIYDITQNLNINSFEKTGYTFGGWAYEENGNAVYKDGEEVTNLNSSNRAVVNLYAVWEINRYILKFVSDGIEILNAVTLDYNENYILNSIEKTGFTFNGWYASETFTGEPLNSVMVTADTTVYAKYTILSYTVSFVAEGNSIDPQTVEFGGNAVAPVAPSYTGSGTYVFAYWSKTEGGQIPYLFNSAVTENVTLYAVWTADTVTLTILNNLFADWNYTVSAEGSLTANDDIVYYREGYKLQGYYLDAEYTDVAEFPLTITADGIIYAYYTAATANVSYRYDFTNGCYEAILTADTADDIVIADTYWNGAGTKLAKVKSFDARGFRFENVEYGRYVNSVKGAGGFTGDEFALPKYLQSISGLNYLETSTFVFDNFIEYGETQSSNYTVQNGALYSENTLIKYPTLNLALSYTVPSGITAIAAYAAYGCDALTTVSLNEVTNIGEYAFAYCSNLDFDTEIYTGTYQPNSFIYTAGSTSEIVLNGCGITSVFADGTVAEYVTKITFTGVGELTCEMTGSALSVTEIEVSGYDGIGAYAFKNYPLLETAALNGVEIIGSGAFEGIIYLETVTGNDFTTINEKAFYGASGLSVINIENVTYFGDYALSGSGIVDFIDVLDLTISSISYGYRALEGASPEIITANSLSDILACIGDFKSTVKELTLLKSAAGYSFKNCANLEKLTLGDVKTVSADFSGTSINNIIFAYNITVADEAFADCDSLLSVTALGQIGLGSGTFANCDALKTVVLTDKNYLLNGGGNAPFDNIPVENVAMRFDIVTLENMFGVTNLVKTITALSGGNNEITTRGLAGAENATAITIGDGIINISDRAFLNCSALRNLIIPSCMQYIGNNAFQNTNLTSLSISGNFVFSKLLGGTVSALDTLTITAKTGVTKIADEAYKNCALLRNITLDNSITEIGRYAFSGCTGITSFNLSEIGSIGGYAFSGAAVTELSVPFDTVLQENALFGLEQLAELTIGGSYTLEYLTGGISALLKTVTIANGTTAICSEMFKNQTLLLNIILPDGLLGIGGYAFYNAENITKFYLSNSLELIGEYAFYGCSMLSSVIVPVKVSDLKEATFAECIRLESAQILGSLSKISKNLFYNCVSLSSVNLPYSVCDIEEYAFYNNTKLINLTLPSGLERIDSYAFYNNTVLENLNFPEGIISVGQYAFYGCASFTAVKLPNGTKNIGDEAFGMCIKITNANIPDGIETLGQNVLYNCTQLTELKLPAQYSLPDVFGGDNPPLISKLTYTKGNRVISDGAMANVFTVSEVILEDGIREIGDNAFYNCFTLSAINLPASVVKIGKAAFYNCNKITNLTLPVGLIDLGGGAFEQCTSLVSINIPAKLYSIGDDTFYNCISLTSVDFESAVNLVTIGNYAFMKCRSLTSIVLPSTLKAIGDWAFSECASLAMVDFIENSKISSLGDYCFKDTKLSSFVLPKECVYLGWGVFDNCVNLSVFGFEEGRDFTEFDLIMENIGMFIFKNTGVTGTENITYSAEESEYASVIGNYFTREKNI